MKKPMKWKRLNYRTKNTLRKYSKTGIQKNNCWHEVAIYCSNLPKNGLKNQDYIYVYLCYVGCFVD